MLLHIHALVFLADSSSSSSIKQCVVRLRRVVFVFYARSASLHVCVIIIIISCVRASARPVARLAQQPNWSIGSRH